MCIKGMYQILFSIIIISLFIFYLRGFERRVIFYPTKEIEYLPSQTGLEFEDIFFKSSDNVDINAWLVPAKDSRYIVLFCHGNAGNISHRVEKIKIFHELGLSVFILDYRGYGKSKGVPSERGIYRDAKSAYDYLLSRKIKAEQIIGYGESIGGAVIIDLAYKNKMAGLIIDSTFSHAKDMAKIISPFLPYWIFSSRFDSIGKIKSIKTPKLIIHSINDEIVPYKFGKKLYDAACEPKEFLEVHGGHNSNFFESEAIYRDKIKDFVNKLPK